MSRDKAHQPVENGWVDQGGREDVGCGCQELCGAVQGRPVGSVEHLRKVRSSFVGESRDESHCNE